MCELSAMAMFVQHQVRQAITRGSALFSCQSQRIKGISSALVRVFTFAHGMVDGHSTIVGVKDCIWGSGSHRTLGGLL